MEKVLGRCFIKLRSFANSCIITKDRKLFSPIEVRSSDLLDLPQKQPSIDLRANLCIKDKF